MADTGFVLVTSGSNNSSAGTVAWTNPGNVTADDAARATSAMDKSTTQYLFAQNIGSVVPAGATIDGIIVRLQKSQNAGAWNVTDLLVNLLKAGAVVGSNLADTVTAWPSSDSDVDYGGAANLWGTTWTAADVNGSGFGVCVRAQCPGGVRTAQVDAVWIKVFYTEAIIFSDPVRTPIKTDPPRGRVAAFFQPLKPYTPVTAAQDWIAHHRSIRPKPALAGAVRSFFQVLKPYTPVTTRLDWPMHSRSVAPKLPNRGRAREAFQLLAPYTPVTAKTDWTRLERSVAIARKGTGRMAAPFVAMPPYTPVTVGLDWLALEHSMPAPRAQSSGRAVQFDVLIAEAPVVVSDAAYAQAAKSTAFPMIRPYAGRLASFYPGPIIVTAPPGSGTVRTLTLTGTGT